MIKKYFRRLCIFIFCIWIFYSIQFVYKVFIGSPLCLTIKIADKFKYDYADIFIGNYPKLDSKVTEKNTYWQGRINYELYWNVDWYNAFNLNTIHLHCKFGDSFDILVKLPDGRILSAKPYYHAGFGYEKYEFIIGNNDIIYLDHVGDLAQFFRYHLID